MFYQTIDLKETFPEALAGAPETPLVRYSPEESREIGIGARPAMIVCPGGGYEFLSDREAEVVALQFLAKGYHAFVLRYAIKPYTYPIQLSQAAAAVRYLRLNAAELGIAPDRIAIMGFSAGGHLAGSLAVLGGEQSLLQRFSAEKGSLTPNAAVLCYPVVTNNDFRHEGSLKNVSGGDERIADYLSLEDRVDADTPPVFLWHTSEDAAVDVRNSLWFAAACRAKGVPFELHVYEKGPHGLSLCDARVKPAGCKEYAARAGAWLETCFSWLNERGFGL